MSNELATIEPSSLSTPDTLIEIGIQKLAGCGSDAERQEVHSWAEEGKRRAEYIGFPALARVFQWLKNEADYATAQAHPAPPPGERNPTGSQTPVTASVTGVLPASRLSELRTVATVWEPLRGHILDDDVADLPERGEMLAEARRLASGKPHLSQALGQEEWNTPEALLVVAREAMGGIDLDPASNPQAQSRVQARKFYTKDENGLTQPWVGRIYLNPPYTGGLVDQFADKLIAEYVAGNVTEAVWLTNNSADTGWFHRLAEKAAVVVFLRGRVKFWKVGKDSEELQGSPLQGQVLMYLGQNAKRFVTACAGQQETNGYVSTHWGG